MNRIPGYQARCTSLAAAFRAAQATATSFGIQKTASNLFRRRDVGGKHKLDVRSFNHVLRIDRHAMTADVEGMTTYETLVDQSLPYGVLPAVVPQLKTITVGGAVSGLGIESSSFRYGLVHETVEEMDVLIGDGSIISCSPFQNQNLFFGLPNSYGTLGYALRLKIRLVPAKPYTHLTHTRFTEPRAFFSHLTEACEDDSADFVDATLFGEHEMYITRAVFSIGAPQVSDYTYMDIYYRSIQRKRHDWLTSNGYIWRWDTDWFWCSKHFGVQKPVIRLLSKFALNSRSYQRLMRLSQKILPASTAVEAVIQDVHVPAENAPALWDFLHRQIGILPVWVCPFKTSDRIFELCGLELNRLYFNFGFWDLLPATLEPGHFNRLIERKVAELKGRKALYSTSYYDWETFWSLYNRRCFDELKKAYDPDGFFPGLYAKCVERR